MGRPHCQQCFSLHPHRIPPSQSLVSNNNTQLSQTPISNNTDSPQASVCFILYALLAILSFPLQEPFSSSNLLHLTSLSSQPRCFRNLLFSRWPGRPCPVALLMRHLWRNASTKVCRGTADQVSRMSSPTDTSISAKVSFT
jgi:hypothetical protein